MLDALAQALIWIDAEAWVQWAAIHEPDHAAATDIDAGRTQWARDNELVDDWGLERKDTKMEIAATSTEERAERTEEPYTGEALRRLWEQLDEQKACVARLEEELAAAKKKATYIAEQVLPDVLESVGLDAVTYQGYAYELRKTVRASLSKERSERGCEWLRARGYGDVVKSQLHVDLGKGPSAEQRAAAVEAVNEAGFDGVFVERVEPSTLSALVRDLQRSGAEIDTALLGVYERTTVSRKKARR